MSETAQTVENKTADRQNEKIISMWQYFVDCLSCKYCSFKGRANRKEFWSFTLFYYLITVVLFFILGVIEGFSDNSKLFNIMNYVWGAAFLLPNIGIKVRRLHDINFSGWWYGGFYILVFSMAIAAGVLAVANYADGVPAGNQGVAKSLMFILGGVAAIGCGAVLCVMPFIAGTNGNNKYGEVPEGKDFKTSTVLLFILLPIAGIFVAGSISGYSKTMNRYKTNKVIDDLIYIVATTKSAFTSPEDYTALNDGRIVEQVFADAQTDRKPNDGSFVNFVGGNILMKPSGRYVRNDNKAFIVTFDGLSEAVCKNIVVLNWAKNSAGFMAMHIFEQNTVSPGASADIMDDITVKSATDIGSGIITAGDGEQSVPLSEEDIDKLCACGNPNTCAITWKFY